MEFDFLLFRDLNNKLDFFSDCSGPPHICWIFGLELTQCACLNLEFAVNDFQDVPEFIPRKEGTVIFVEKITLPINHHTIEALCFSHARRRSGANQGNRAVGRNTCGFCGAINRIVFKLELMLMGSFRDSECTFCDAVCSGETKHHYSFDGDANITMRSFW